MNEHFPKTKCGHTETLVRDVTQLNARREKKVKHQQHATMAQKKIQTKRLLFLARYPSQIEAPLIKARLGHQVSIE